MNLRIQADCQSIDMGRSVRVEALLEAPDPSAYILLPFVNARRWGAHEFPNAEGRAVFTLPLPNPGPARVQVLALPRSQDDWMGMDDHELLLAGRLMPESGERSNCLDLEVAWRRLPDRRSGDSFFCMQWEPWFNWGPRSWRTAQSVPVIGFYESYNRDSIRQHMLWFMGLGVDFILPDWTNHLWGKTSWDQRSEGVNAIVHATTLALEVLAELRAEGHPVPKVALFPGISNGPPTTMQALNEELAWIYHTYVRNPRFEGLWQEFDGKPLMVVLDTGALGDPRARAESAFRIPFFKQTLNISAEELDAIRATQIPVDDSQFTIRWMSSQNQTTRHHELGLWSWMDGGNDPTVTYNQGQAECVTVTPASFNAFGWTGEGAYGRRGGATYLETFRAALQHRPKVIFLHQFNEFTGQREGHGMGPDKNIYVDTYNVELSDDLEPVSSTAPGYRADQGGWGFIYLNLTRALMDLYRSTCFDSTLLAVSSPLPGTRAAGNHLLINWTFLGAQPAGFSLSLDGKTVQSGLTGSSAEVSLSGIVPGEHVLTVTAEGASTRYPLSREHLDDPLSEPVPVQVKIPFTYAPGE